MKFIFRLFLAIVITGIVMLIVFSFLAIYVIGDRYYDGRNLHCAGRIVSIDSTRSCFVTIKVQQQNNYTDLEACYCSDYDSSFFRSIAIGDSLIKNSESDYITVVTKVTSRRKEYQYPSCISK